MGAIRNQCSRTVVWAEGRGLQNGGANIGQDLEIPGGSYNGNRPFYRNLISVPRHLIGLHTNRETSTSADVRN